MDGFILMWTFSADEVDYDGYYDNIWIDKQLFVLIFRLVEFPDGPPS